MPTLHLKLCPFKLFSALGEVSKFLQSMPSKVLNSETYSTLRLKFWQAFYLQEETSRAQLLLSDLRNLTAIIQFVIMKKT